MKRRYKLLLIILSGVLLAILINFITVEDKITLVAMGDGVSIGMMSSNIVGYSYNDYLKEYYETKNDLDSYNNEFSEQHLTIENLNMYLEKNVKGSKTKVPIKQILAKADLITINIGMDELIDYSTKNMLNEKRIDTFILNYNEFIKQIRSFYDKEILIVGLYPFYNLDNNSIYEINNRIKKIAGNNKVKFLDITAISLNSEYYTSSSYYMNYKGHQAIYKEILKNI